MDAQQRRQQAHQVIRELAAELSPDRPARDLDGSEHLEWELGIGSLERLELSQRLERALSGQLPAQALFAAHTVAEVLDIAENPESVPDLPARTRPVPETGRELPPFPEGARSTLEALAYQAEKQPDRPLYHFEHEGELERSLSPAQLWREAGTIAASLADLGVRPGDRVGVMLPTGVAFVACFFGVQWLGAVPVPLYPPFRPDQAEDYVNRQAAILENAGVEVLISFSRAWSMTQLLRLKARRLREIVSSESLGSGRRPPEPHPYQASQLGLIQYTSGSTGLPKGVALTHANLLHNLRAYGQALQVRSDDVCVSWLPLYHDMGLIGSLLGSIYHGIPLALLAPQDFLARPARWLRALHDYRGTISPAPNFAYEVCARRISDEELQGLDLSCWRVALNGAEPVRRETLERFSRRFEAYGFRPQAHFPAYGLAEAALAVAFNPLNRGARVDRVSQAGLEQRRQALPAQAEEAALELVSAGVALPGTELRILDESGQPLEERREGKLFFRSGSALESYFDNPQATREIKDAEGWVATGDLAYLADGELYITGRSKDIIVKAGRNLHPQDIEELVCQVDGVRRGCVAAFGVSDGDSGSERLVVVFETRQAGLERATLCSEVRHRLAQGLGVPADQVVAVDPGLLPKTPSGKIRRRECRDLFLKNRLNRRAGVAGQIYRLLRQSRPGLRDLKQVSGNWLRGVWHVGSMLALVGTPGLLLSQVAPGLAGRLVPAASRLWLRLVGLRLQVRGRLPAGPCLVVSNHASLIDALIVLAAARRPLQFLVAPWIYDQPFLKRALRQLGHLRATRGDTEGARELSGRVIDRLRAGSSLATFPEGGIETSPGLRPFSTGIFQVAAQLGAPLIPVAIRGNRQALPWPRFVVEPGTLEVTWGEPLRAHGEGWEDALALARATRAWISEQCGEPPIQERLRRDR